MEDEQIIKLYLKRSEKALEETQNKYGPYCYRIAKNIFTVREDAEECVNDTYMGTWNSIPPQKPIPLSTYVCKIARNIALKRYRYNTAKKRNSFYDISLSELEDCIPSAAQNTVSSTEEDLTEIIEHFLDSLDKKSRIMFVKRYWYAESIAAIATEFDMTENHVAVRLLRTRNKMKTYLEKKGVIV